FGAVAKFAAVRGLAEVARAHGAELKAIALVRVFVAALIGAAGTARILGGLAQAGGAVAHLGGRAVGLADTLGRRGDDDVGPGGADRGGQRQTERQDGHGDALSRRFPKGPYQHVRFPLCGARVMWMSARLTNAG